jgi:hypothetical protein
MLYNRGYGSVEYRSIETVLTLAFSQDPTMATPPLPQISRVITPPSAAGARRSTHARPAADGCARALGVSGQRRRVSQGEALSGGARRDQLWVINNDTKWDHPFHLHGYFFMPVDEKGEPIRPMAWKDTINIPMNTIARVLVAFDERPGTWMFHCHILDHAEIGLMGTVTWVRLPRRAQPTRIDQAV